MLKIHIEDINNKGKVGLSPPGPGKYEPKKTFGAAGFHKSFSPRLGFDSIALKRQKGLPGPGQYKAPEVISQGIINST